MGWLTNLIKEKHEPIQMTKKRGHIGKLKLWQISNLIQLDKHFQKIPSFTGLKKFKYYCKVVQWTGNKQKTIVKQLITVATLLLMHDVPKTIHCTHMILNFIMLA